MKGVVLVFVTAVLLVLGAFGFMSEIPAAHAWSGTVYIRSDGRVEPTGAPVNTTDGIVYLVWDDISVSGGETGIIIERDNIILDGRGFSVQGSSSMFNPTYGIRLEQRNNVTIKNLAIQGHEIGIIVSESVNVRIQANNMVDNFLAIQLSYSNHSTIIRNNITGCIGGIVIKDSSNNNVVSENYLMGVGESAFTGTGISLDGSNNLIMRNTITNYFACGVSLSYASTNTIYANNITLNGAAGIELGEYADNNTVAGNIIAFNGYGINIYQASGNRIYHNNFKENGEDIFIDDGVVNYFDGGYPAGGNFWDEHGGDDSFHGENQDIPGSDGIIDTAYQAPNGIVDRYPLAAPITPLPTIAIGELTFNIDVISNSTVSNLYINPDEGPFLRFNVSGPDGTAGFSTVIIPKTLLWTDKGWNITINGEAITNYLELSDEKNTYLYFTYTHTTKTITIQGTNIIPEYPTTTLVTLLLSTTTLLVAIIKRKTRNKA